MTDPAADSILDDARRFLRGHLSGELQFDEHLRPLNIVIGHDGRIAAPVMVAMLESAETVLFLPQADENAFQMLVSLEQFAEEGAAGHLADRWRIYHGEPEDVRWAFFHPDAVRFRGAVIDGDAVAQPNPLRSIEPAVCRDVNTTRRDALRSLVKRTTNLDLEDHAMLVGIDPHGLDVRGPFDIVRVEFARPINDPDLAREHITRLLNETERA